MELHEGFVRRISPKPVKKRKLLVEVQLRLSLSLDFHETHACSIDFCKIIRTECIRIVW